MNNEQIAYVVDQLKAGHTRATIREVLTQSGYEAHTIDALFTEADARMLEVPRSHSEPTPHSVAVAEAVTDEDLDVAEEVASPELAKVPETPRTTASSRFLIPALLVGTVLILLVGLAAASFSGILPWPAFLSGGGGVPLEEGNELRSLQQGLASIESASYTATFSLEAVEKDSDTYLLPKEVRGEDYEETWSLLTMIPADVKAQAEIAGTFDRSDDSSQDSYTRLAGRYITDDLTVNANFELIFSQMSGAYFRVNNMPSLFLFDFSPIKGEWVHFIDQPLGSLVEEQPVVDEDGEQYKYILEEMLAHNIFTLKGEPQVEEREGVRVYQYSFVIDGPALRQYIMATNRGLAERFGENHLWAGADVDVHLERITNPMYVDFINAHQEIQVWVNAAGQVVRFGITARRAVDDDLAKFSFFSNDMYEDMSKQSWMSALRSQAELYYDGDFSYAGFCDSEFFAGDTYIPAPTWSVDCNATPTAYAVEVLLSDSTYCIDSTGYSDFGSILLVGDTVCNSVTERVEAEVPAEEVAERQVNFSFYVDLTGINEPVVVEIPTDALTLEEAAEKMPAIGGYLSMFASLEETQSSSIDASVKQHLSGLRAEAELHYDDNGRSYAGMCENLIPRIENSIQAVVSCNDTDAAYAAEAATSQGYFCVDSTGFATESSLEMLEGTKCVDLLR